MNNNPIAFLSPIARMISLSGIGLVVLGCSQAETEKRPAADAIPQGREASASMPQTEIAKTPPSTPAVRTAGSHVHGGSVLSIVSEADIVFVELETPLYNLLGFEYAPQTAAEKKRVSEVQTKLAQPETLFRFNSGASCAHNALPNPPSLFKPPHKESAHDQGSADYGHDDHEHDEHGDENHRGDNQGHGHEDGEDMDTHGDDDHAAEAGHKDVVLSYSLTCKHSDKLKTIRVGFFDAFTNFTKIDLVYLGPSQQTGIELLPSKPTADLTR